MSLETIVCIDACLIGNSLECDYSILLNLIRKMRYNAGSSVTRHEAWRYKPQETAATEDYPDLRPAISMDR